MAVPTDNVNLTNLDAGTDNPASARADLHNFGVLIKAIISAMGGGGATSWNSTNDGAASGLDADLLDGQHGAYYRDASNLNAGTIPETRLSINKINYAIDKAIRTGRECSTSSQSVNMQAFAFSENGSTLYSIGFNNHIIYQYSLSDPHNPNSATYSTKSLDVSAQVSNVSGILFNTAGTIMYVASDAVIYQYTLSTAGDVSTGSYASKSLSFATQDADITGVSFNSDITKVYALGNTNKVIYQYTLSTAEDVSTGSYDSKSLSCSAQVGSSHMYGLQMSVNGDRIFTTDYSGGTVLWYALSTTDDVSTGSYSGIDLDVIDISAVRNCMAFKPDGSRLYFGNRTGIIREFITQALSFE